MIDVGRSGVDRVERESEREKEKGGKQMHL